LFDKIRNDRALRQVFLYILLVLLFEVENLFIVGKYKMYSPIDDRIPFVPVFVIFYFLWYAMIAVIGIYFLLKSKEDLRKTFLSINISTAAAIIIYFLFPNYQALRPLSYGSDFFSQWVKMLQSGDSPSVCITLFLGVVSCKLLKGRKLIKLLVLILTVLICVSTVFIKQHSVVDVAAGILLSAAVYMYVYIISEKIQAKRTKQSK
jgi:membrane-associated phospholipid phosphatase